MKKLDINDSFCPPHLKSVATLPCEMHKSYLALYNSEFIIGSAYIDSTNYCESCAFQIYIQGGPIKSKPHLIIIKLY